MPLPSSLLFVPGTRPELLTKALASGAGLVCVDLEDAVAPEAKDEARAATLGLLAGGDAVLARRLVVRVNHPSTEDGMRDLAALAAASVAPPVSRAGDGSEAADAASEERPAGRQPAAVVIPKVASHVDVASARSHFRAAAKPAVIAMIETAAGLSRCEHIAAADGVVGLLFGGLDLSHDLGCALDWEALLYARSRCVLAARLARASLWDTPWFDVRDSDGLRSEARRGRRLGFHGKAAIHPAQVPVIESVFAPSEDEVAGARTVIRAFEERGEGVFALDGVMIDRPAVEAARRVVERAEVARPDEDA